MGLFALAHDTAVLLLVGLWFGPALWIYTDARARCASPERPAQLLIAALLFPLVTPLVYGCVRPPESIAERRARDLARRLLEEELAPDERCLACRTPLEEDFLRCPGCAAELRRPCRHCAEPLRLHWSACPHCTAAVSPDAAMQLVA
jgi:hypothetical protein